VSYTVVWTDTALSQLEFMWINSANRDSITRAQVRIDQHLGNDPRRHAIEIANGLFTFDARPIQAIFEIVEDDRIVRIDGVRLIP
jgi:hypothetical protein